MRDFRADAVRLINDITLYENVMSKRTFTKSTANRLQEQSSSYLIEITNHDEMAQGLKRSQKREIAAVKLHKRDTPTTMPFNGLCMLPIPRCQARLLA